MKLEPAILRSIDAATRIAVIAPLDSEGAYLTAVLADSVATSPLSAGDTVLVAALDHEELFVLASLRQVQTPEAWATPTLLNGWTAYGGGYQLPGYYRDPSGTVWLRGLVKAGTLTQGTTMFTLPPGYAPPNTIIFTVTSSNAWGEVRVTPSGDVKVWVTPTGATWVCLDGLSFRV